MTTRLQTLDSTKGLLLVLMTITHIGLVINPAINNINHRWFFLFKMPGFYIISGWLMFTSVRQHGFLRRKIDGIYKPYFALCCAMFMIYYALGFQTDMRGIVNVLLGFDFHLGNTSVFPAWFILNLLPAFAVCKYLIVSRSIALKAAIILLLVLIGHFPALSNVLPFNMAPCVYSVAFMMTGYLLRVMKIEPGRRVFILPCGIFYVLSVCFFSPDMTSLDIAGNIMNTPLLTYFIATAGVFLVTGMLSYLKETGFTAVVLRVLSQNSLYVLVLHYPVFQWLTSLTGLPEPEQVGQLALMNVFTLVVCVCIGTTLKKIDHRGIAFRPSRKKMMI